ncbi:DUF1998 domain-containing protein [Neiella marina]|uniref:DUF1998 domain-containing protein n=1 Tax=Neiella holothuriorum TaxID=2870530 RepID=A0ABS7EEF5_9GAMM|nr:DUF1998 domain-containing protein [Neiella holothuriorum]MBW8190313.1 DUF1998 domain-containing protein [Neiella holothuriorum]
MNKSLTPVRLSHIGAQQGVGSIARLKNDYTGVIVDTRFWFQGGKPEPQYELRNVSRIQRCLEIPQKLYLPPTGNEKNESGIAKSIPAVLFPGYLQCVQCDRLDLNPWEENPHHSAQKPRCGCGGVMNQGTYCVVDNYGNLDNVDWNYLCHHQIEKMQDENGKSITRVKQPQGRQAECYLSHQKKNLKLTFKEGAQKIVCGNCGAEVNFEPNQLGIKPRKPQPWIFERIPKEPDGFKRKGEVVEINHPSVYTPVIQDGLVIPPESNNEQDLIDTSYILKHTDELEDIISAPSDFVREGRMIQVVRKLGASLDEVKKAVQLFEFGNVDEEEPELVGTPGQMKEEEFEALITEQSFSPSADFKTKHLDDFLQECRESLPEELRDLSNIVGKLIKVERLRKVQVFQGFLRSQRDLNPDSNTSGKELTPEEKESFQPQLVSPDIYGGLDWLPAINLYGEGIFITLPSSWLSRWESHTQIALRVNELELHYEASESQLTVDELSPRFILLHTLAHLLIRELEDKCGYPASSLSERIYASREADMSGLLIYTTVADKSGSLGGLMELADPKAFLTVLSGALKRAQWCTLDPVCSEHSGQGRDGLNRAACHGCTLVPDTSCDYGNVFLDRTLIKGDKAAGIPSLLEFIKGNHHE